MLVDKKDIARFCKYVVKKDSGCWEWIGVMTVHGYGHFWWKKKYRRAHRMSWAIVENYFPAVDQLICHKCDNKKCVNPDHLYSGDYFDNNRDTVIRKRNMKIKQTHCKRGHEFTFENTLLQKSSFTAKRICRKCAHLHYKARING